MLTLCKLLQAASRVSTGLKVGWYTAFIIGINNYLKQMMNITNIARSILNMLVAAVLFTSCKSIQEVAYIQDIQLDTPKQIVTKEIKIVPDDMLSIVVSSSNPELVVPFNMPLVSYQFAQTGVNSGGQQRLLSYIVDSKGCIDFPILGKMKVAGMSRRELGDEIKERLAKEGLVKDAVVIVQFQNFKVSVMGEVNTPRAFTISTDRITLLEALSMAGDLTVYGRRDRVIVLREENGKRIAYVNDLRSAKLFESPCYYLQQNDIVYVEPNKIKAGQRNINQNTSVSTWVSIVSLLVSVAILVWR